MPHADKEKRNAYMRKWSRESYKKNPEKHRERQQRYRERNPGFHREYHRKTKYGLTEEQFTALLNEQQGLCAICFSYMELPHVDHCHRTDRVRGLLCGNCNRGLGQFQDDIGNLAQAIVYLSGCKRS